MTTVDSVTGRILLVEDDGGDRTVLARSLRDLGHVVAEASDCAEALEWTASWPPDVVLLDQSVSDDEGMTLLARLKADTATRDVPVVIVTSSPEEPFVGEALRSGAHDYLTKPFHAEEVRARTHAALRTKALVDELRQAATQDPLTGLRNRRGVLEQLSSWRAHCRRHGTPLTVALLDINGLARINEAHSHAVGDRVLRGVAEALQACLRLEDVVGRWSGHEFVVLLPSADTATAIALVERVSARLARQQLLPDRTVTLRAGIAVAPPGSAEEDERLLGRAAMALHERRSKEAQTA
jgi:two-component system cell cycle response regulator